MSEARSVRPGAERLLRYTTLPFIRMMWRPKLEDTGHFIKGPCFVYGNHSNNLDPFILNLWTAFGESTTGVLALDHMRKGFKAKLMKGIGMMATRKNVAEPHLIKDIYRHLDQGHSVVIYPEGGRRWAGRPGPWIESTAKLFIRCGVPVYPIVTHGSYAGWPRWANYMRPSRIRVACQEPLRFERRTPLKEALAQLKAPIDFDENVVADEVKPKWAYRPADGIERLLYRDWETGEVGSIYTPDGTYVVNRAGTIRLKMLPDSTLLDEKTGEVLLTGDLYEQVKAIPLTKDAEGAFVSNRVDLHSEDEFPQLDPHGVTEAVFHEDAIRLKKTDEVITLGLDAITYVTVERNDKLQLYTDDRMYQLTFAHGGSALQWELLFKTLKEQLPSPSSSAA